MALWHGFKLLNLEIDNEEMEIIHESNSVNYYPQKNMLMLDISYYTGQKSKFLCFSFKERKRINLKFNSDKFEIKVLEQGDEQTKQLKNAGGGALVGAVIAGPVGAPIGYLKEQAKSDFFDKK